jgi:hypothetical protein
VGVGEMVLLNLRRSGITALVLACCLLVVSGVSFPAVKPLPFDVRVVQRAELPGFGRPDSTLYTSARAWTQASMRLSAAQTAAQVARLAREGFVAVLLEHLRCLNQRGGAYSWVMRLGSADSARAELAVTFREMSAQPGASPSVLGAIPGSHAVRTIGGGQVEEAVLFADGPFLYVLDAGWPSGGKSPVTAAQLSGAVTHLYERVRGHPPA